MTSWDTAEESRLEAYFDQSSDSIFVVDGDGQIVRCNDRVRDMLGYEPDELVGELVETLVPEASRQGHPAKRTGYFDDPEVRRMGGRQKLQAVRADGEVIPVDVGLSPIQVDGRSLVLASVRDMSEHHRLQAEQSKYRAAFEKAFDAIVIADDQGRYTEVNESACEMFGLERAELLGKRIADFAPEDFDFDRAWREFAESERERGVFPLVSADGTERVVEYAATFDIVPGRHLSILRDVTEREERSRQLRVIDTELRHILRNNINVIQGYTTLLEDTVDEGLETRLQRVFETTEHLLETINKARRITQFLAEPAKTRDIDLVRVVESTVADARVRFPDADIAVDGPEEAVVCATDGIDDALRELVENAVVYSNGSSPRVDVTISNTGGSYRVSVADYGPGIPEAEIDVLTGKTEVTPLHHAGGFGLWLVSHVVKQSQGGISFSENSPEGSVVTITLPGRR